MAEFNIQVNAGSAEVEAFLRSLNVDLPCGTTAKDWPEHQQMAEPARSGGTASQAESGNTDGRLLRLMETLSAEMSSMKAQVANLASRMDAQDSGNTQSPSQPSPSEQGTGQPTPEVRNAEPPRAVTPLTTTCWADSDPEAPLGELGPVSFPDDLADMRDQASESGDSEKTRVVPVSEHTATFLKKTFTSRAPNATRRKWWNTYGVPKGNETRCPSLDSMYRPRLSKEARNADSELCRFQAYALDPVGPLTFILEEGRKGTLTKEDAAEAAETALSLIGHASMAFNQERHKKALLEMNNEIVDLASEDVTFSDAAPDLFGKGFASTAKQRADELKCLKQVQHQKRSFLGGRRPQDHRGGGSYRGSGSYQGNGPYQGSKPFRGRGGYGYRGRQRMQPYHRPATGKENTPKQFGRSN